MTKKSEGWLSRRGQSGAATAVELVLERQPQEPVQQLADELIEDSPYQARGPINDASVSELAQGMASAGFQGVLIVRPHGDAKKRRQGIFQLVYGHRRRAAWRFVCQERREPCVLPVVVREVSDAQMLTIGAQENLQRQDLDPVEEAQIVAWAERMFFDKNQAEIGAMLGKSEDWVRLRARVTKLPDELKDALRQRPRAMSQVLELAPLYRHNPAAALALASRVVDEQLTLERLRQMLRGHARLREEQAPLSAEPDAPPTPAQAVRSDTLPDHLADGYHPVCDTPHNRGGAAVIVKQHTKDIDPPPSSPPNLESSVSNQIQRVQLVIRATRQQIEALSTIRERICDQPLGPGDAQTLSVLLDTLADDIEALRAAARALPEALVHIG